MKKFVCLLYLSLLLGSSLALAGGAWNPEISGSQSEVSSGAWQPEVTTSLSCQQINELSSAVQRYCIAKNSNTEVDKETLEFINSLQQKQPDILKGIDCNSPLTVMNLGSSCPNN